MSELKPCPFCGGDAKQSFYGGKRRLFLCSCTICEASLPWQETEEAAIAAWNRRAPRPGYAAGAEAMRGTVAGIVQQLGYATDDLDERNGLFGVAAAIRALPILEPKEEPKP